VEESRAESACVQVAPSAFNIIISVSIPIPEFGSGSLLHSHAQFPMLIVYQLYSKFVINTPLN
jgi:hypothetical protein